jgi:hypothetical protein
MSSASSMVAPWHQPAGGAAAAARRRTTNPAFLLLLAVCLVAAAAAFVPPPSVLRLPLQQHRRRSRALVEMRDGSMVVDVAVGDRVKIKPGVVLDGQDWGGLEGVVSYTWEKCEVREFDVGRWGNLDCVRPASFDSRHTSQLIENVAPASDNSIPNIFFLFFLFFILKVDPHCCCAELGTVRNLKVLICTCVRTHRLQKGPRASLTKPNLNNPHTNNNLQDGPIRVDFRRMEQQNAEAAAKLGDKEHNYQFFNEGEIVLVQRGGGAAAGAG